MTPLYRYLLRFAPPNVALALVILTYAALLLAIGLTVDVGGQDPMFYLDE